LNKDHGFNSGDRTASKRVKKTVAPVDVLKGMSNFMNRAVKLTLIGIGSFMVLVMVSAGMILGYLYLSKSDYLQARPESILVKGLGRLTKSEVLAAAGLDKPVNILTLNTSAALKSLTSHPWVDKAELSRSFPDSISLEVTEYRPKALVSLEHLYYIDDAGRAFKKLDPGENPDLPIISGFNIDVLMNSGPLFRENIGEIFRLMSILAQRTDEFNIANISEFHYDPDMGLTIFTRQGGFEVKAGFGAYTEKFARLGRVMTYLKAKDQLAGLFYLNLDCPPRVTVRYKPSYRPQPMQAQGPETLPES
jgi:cell division protein FtsQ